MSKVSVSLVALISLSLTAFVLYKQAAQTLQENKPLDNNHLSSQIPEAVGYNISTSKKYAAYTKVTYCPHDLIKNWSCKDCQTYNQISDIHLIENTKRDIFAYAFYDTQEKKIILAWRGTIDFKNTVLDLEYVKIPYTCTRCEVHLGFYEAFRAVAKEVNDAIQTLHKKYPDAHVMTTGHSLGAALSTISAIEINKKSPKLVNQIHNFGCPRVGNQYLSRHIAVQFNTLFRVVHDHDIFTHLPEQTQNYHHYPFEVLYDSKMENYQICDSTGEDPSCSNEYAPDYNKPDHWFYFFPMNETDCKASGDYQNQQPLHLMQK